MPVFKNSNKLASSHTSNSFDEFDSSCIEVSIEFISNCSLMIQDNASTFVCLLPSR